MGRENYQSDFDIWMAGGFRENAGKGPAIDKRTITLEKKMKPKELYDMMIRSDADWPFEFQLKSKEILFAHRAYAAPILKFSLKTLWIERNKKTTIAKHSLKDALNVKKSIETIKGAVKGDEATLKELGKQLEVTDPDTYFNKVCTLVFPLVYDLMSEKALSKLRTGR